jgi:hypothetical protein
MCLLFSRSRHVCVVGVARRTFFPYILMRIDPGARRASERAATESKSRVQPRHPKGVFPDFHAPQSHLPPPTYICHIEREIRSERAVPTCIFHSAAVERGALFFNLVLFPEKFNNF